MLLDGSTGAMLQKRGMPQGVCPELWASENPKILTQLQKEYVQAGANIIFTFTFGANPLKLEEFGLKQNTFELNKKLAKLSKKVAGKKVLVAGDISSTGRFPKPFGDLLFNDCVNAYKEQVKGLVAGGVDLIVIETMIDIQEARAALLAVKETCGLPVIVSMTFDKDKRTVTGTDPITALITLQAMGADSVGCNCSTGPKEMLDIIKLMKPYAKVPLMAKPNAGLPKLVQGKTIFEMEVEEFAAYTKAFVKAGVNLFGGCCGTTPEFITQVAKNLKGTTAKQIKPVRFSAVTSSRKTVFIGNGEPVCIIGERINPTGKKLLQEELKAGTFSEVRRFAAEQYEKGAALLDVNVGMPGVIEKDKMVEVIELLSNISEAPLCVDSSSPEVIETALRIYPGRALLNSISGEHLKLKKLLPVAAKYGAMFILLPLDDKGIPAKAVQRYKIVEKVIKAAKTYGYTTQDIAVDGLVMTVSADQKAANETLILIEKVSKGLGAQTVCGLSNVSFGLPERGLINAAFLAMAIKRGLTMAIANPAADLITTTKAAFEVLSGKDKNSAAYIKKFSNVGAKVVTPNPKIGTLSISDKIFSTIIKGDRDNINRYVEEALAGKTPASQIVDEMLIPAISKVGDLYEQKKYFLPQLIQSAETMKLAFAKVEPFLKKQKGKAATEKKAIVLATVKGDIHDIGKNIVALMLRNYGFKVYDLGKDVHEEAIIKKAKETGAEIVGLSALMTTTMIEMEKVIKLAKKEGLKCKFMIGGAVVNQGYADEIGADAYSKDAYEAVKIVKKLSDKH